MTDDATTTPHETPQPAPDELRLLDAASLHWRMERGRLELRETAEGDWREVGIFRLFPLSEPEGWLSVVDKENTEIGILPDLRHCPHESLALIRQELSRRYLVPQILRIHACRDRFDLTDVEVETDRGRLSFVFRRQQENIQRPLPHRVTLIDIEGNRYDIPDLDNLDEHSRHLLEERI